MKRLFLASTILLAPLLMPSRGEAQFAVYCANCATIAEELISDAKQAQQYATQVQQQITQLQQYRRQLTDALALPQEIYADVQGDIMQVRNLANAASLLTGNSGSIMQRLSAAGSYANQLSMTPAQITNQFTMWQQTIANSGLALGRTLGVQQGQEANYTALQQAIQAHSQTAAGQMQAIQAGTEMAALVSTQLNQLQTTLTATAQQAGTRDLIAGERQAAQDAATQTFLTTTTLPTTGNTTFGTFP